nr:RloB domain-containing protein [Saprospiraceae bacterium]
GYNTVSLVNRAAELMRQGDYEQVWCVFDKDDFSDEDFNKAIAIAEAQGMQAAYSNQAFEYWIILHFEDHQGGPMHRSTYADKLNSYLAHWGESYDEDSKIITEEIFALLQDMDPKSGLVRRDLAIRRARRILDQLDHRSPAKGESSTIVFFIGGKYLPKVFI